MIIWFTTLGILGLRAILEQPVILAALNPIYAYNFFAINHIHGIVALASSFFDLPPDRVIELGNYVEI